MRKLPESASRLPGRPICGGGTGCLNAEGWPTAEKQGRAFRGAPGKRGTRSCDGWGGTAYNIGFDITQFDPGPYTWGGFLWIMYTTENGCGPGGGGDAGAMIDDLWFEGPVVAVENESWGVIKSMFR